MRHSGNFRPAFSPPCKALQPCSAMMEMAASDKKLEETGGIGSANEARMLRNTRGAAL